MFRAPDAWAVEATKRAPCACGFGDGTPDALERKYERTGKQLGKGGFGEVFIVRSRATGVEYACKSISKSLDVPNISSQRQEQHVANIKREVAVLRKLRGTLNVVYLEDVFEDDTHVHVVMELCKGGELLAKLSCRHYSERTVASYMRAVLRTLAQCHHHRILHRDIKPGNFMLLNDSETSPVKAIDFGLAIFFDPKALPLRNLGLEGTPHYMAPESLSSEVYPATDVWAAGVMAYQLLSGRFPFDDWKNPKNPALSLLWKSILTDELKFSGPAWQDVSDGAKNFVAQLLTKVVKARPSAQQALAHPWLEGKSKQRIEGKPLTATIVQRLQRFSTNNAFKRTVLDMIANELLHQHLQQQAQAQATSKAAPASPPNPKLQLPAQQAGPGAGPHAEEDVKQQPGATLEGSWRGRAGLAPVAAPLLRQSESLQALHALLAGLCTPDPSKPQLRSLAACNIIHNSLHQSQQQKAATVHAGSAYMGAAAAAAASARDVCAASTAHTAAAATGPDPGKLGPASLDLVPPTAASSTAPAGPATPPNYQAPSEAWHTGAPAQVVSRGQATEGARCQPSEELTLNAHFLMQQHLPASSSTRPPAQLEASASKPLGAAHAAGRIAGRAATGSGHTAAVAGSEGGGAWELGPAPKRCEGSGHALQHYAFLLAAGERSLQGLSQRASMHHSHALLQAAQSSPGGPLSFSGAPPSSCLALLPLASPPAGEDTATPAASTLVAATGLSGTTPSSPSPWPAPAGGADASTSGGSATPLHYTVHGVHDVRRLLSTVQRQRREHRKLQRLMLDTSGHAEDLYAEVLAAQQQQQAEVTSEAAPNGAGRGAGAAAVRLPLSAMDVDGEGEGANSGRSGTSPRRKGSKGLLQQIGRALLAPVRGLRRGDQQASNPGQAPSGAFGSVVLSAEPSQKGGGAAAIPTPPAATDAPPSAVALVAAPLASAPVAAKPLSALTAALAGSAAAGGLPVPPRPALGAEQQQHVKLLGEDDALAGIGGGPAPFRTAAHESAAAATLASAAASGLLRDAHGQPLLGCSSLPLAEQVAAMKDGGALPPSPAAAAPSGGCCGSVDLEVGGRSKGAYAALLSQQSSALVAAALLPQRGSGMAAASVGEQLLVLPPTCASSGAAGQGGGAPGLSEPASPVVAGAGAARLSHASSASMGAGAAQVAGGAEAAVAGPAVGSGLAIYTVKGAHQHLQTAAAPPEEPVAPPLEQTIAAQLARIERLQQQQQQQCQGVSAPELPFGALPPSSRLDLSSAAPAVGGSVSRGAIFTALGNLLGGPSQLAEFQAVMERLQYDKHSELSFDQISDGLKMMGYRFEPSEVETLLSEVALGSEAISQGAFLASQVDWRSFQANHREEWLACLRMAFDGLARQTDGRIGEDEILTLLKAKLPEEEVNLAVQETLLDAAVLGAEGLDFDDFARLLQADSESEFTVGSVGSAGGGGPLAVAAAGSSGGGGGGPSHLAPSGTPLWRVPSIDLYDSRMDASVKGNKAAADMAGAVVPPAAAPGSWVAQQVEQQQHASVHGGGGFGAFVPALETVVDAGSDDEEQEEALLAAK